MGGGGGGRRGGDVTLPAQAVACLSYGPQKSEEGEGGGGGVTDPAQAVACSSYRPLQMRRSGGIDVSQGRSCNQARLHEQQAPRGGGGGGGGGGGAQHSHLPERAILSTCGNEVLRDMRQAQHSAGVAESGSGLVIPRASMDVQIAG